MEKVMVYYFDHLALFFSFSNFVMNFFKMHNFWLFSLYFNVSKRC